MEKGHRIRALVHPQRTALYLDGLATERYRGNILEYDSVLEAAKGCDAVIHAAAITRTSPAKSSLIRTVNTQGTRHVIDAVLSTGVKRLIHVGTASSFGFGSKHDPGDETRAFSAKKYDLDYFNSKYEDQCLVLNEIRNNGLRALTVNPTFMVGPY